MNRLIRAAIMLLTLFLTSLALAAEVDLIEPSELLIRLGSPELFVVDVRTPSSWEDSESKIPGAVRVNPKDITELEQLIPPGGEVVLYCA